MPYFQSPDGALHYLSPQDIADIGTNLLPIGSVAITDMQAATIQAPTAAQLWATYQAQAKIQLAFNDGVATRCVKAGTTYPSTWLAVDTALRAIVAASNGDPTQSLPSPPKNGNGSINYPEGT